MHSHRGAPRSTLAIIGGESLLGKEVRELLEGSGLALSIKLIASAHAENSTIIAAVRDEPVVINSIEMADLGSAEVVVLAGDQESSRKAYEQIAGTKSAPVVIDVNGGLEDHPGTRLRAPMAESPETEAAAAIQVIAHPAAIAIALFLAHLRKAGVIRRSVVEIFEPASAANPGSKNCKNKPSPCYPSSRFPKKFMTRRSPSISCPNTAPTRLTS